MSETFSLIILGSLIFFPILYYIVRGAVTDGTLNALLEYDKIKNQQNKCEDDK
ncbi:MAG: hypothetical protein ACM3X7_07275 [Solirubrobacterales bacterium]